MPRAAIAFRDRIESRRTHGQPSLSPDRPRAAPAPSLLETSRAADGGPAGRTLCVAGCRRVRSPPGDSGPARPGVVSHARSRVEPGARAGCCRVRGGRPARRAGRSSPTTRASPTKRATSRSTTWTSAPLHSRGHQLGLRQRLPFPGLLSSRRSAATPQLRSRGTCLRGPGADHRRTGRAGLVGAGLLPAGARHHRAQHRAAPAAGRDGGSPLPGVGSRTSAGRPARGRVEELEPRCFRSSCAARR